GSGLQVHDFNGGILVSGLFWTQPVDALRISRNGREAVFDVKNLPVIDSFQILSGLGTPGTVSFHVEWSATGPLVERGRGRAVPPTDPRRSADGSLSPNRPLRSLALSLDSASDRIPGSARRARSLSWARSATAVSSSCRPRVSVRRAALRGGRRTPVGSLATEAVAATFRQLGLDTGLDRGRIRAAGQDVSVILGVAPQADSPPCAKVRVLITERSPSP
ncbi:MAG: hypothetical protein M3071_13420, partial [Actinomycetota bacterium]|nr:hypothetical protein [Actinomycetota bacterium]